MSDVLFQNKNILKMLRQNRQLKSVLLNRIPFVCKQKCSNGSGKKKKPEDEKDDGNELDEKIKPMERPVGSLHGTDALSEKQRAHEKEYFYREEREQIKALKKKIKEEGSLTPEKKKKEKK